jgi:hypothetical protein
MKCYTTGHRNHDIKAHIERLLNFLNIHNVLHYFYYSALQVSQLGTSNQAIFVHSAIPHKFAASISGT